MHYRFKGNPNTNDAARLLAENKRRAARGLPPLTLAEFTHDNAAGEIAQAAPAPKPKPKPTPQRRMF